MKTIPWIVAALAVASLILTDVSRGHGGTYRGPGNSVPPGGSGDSVAPGATGSGGSGSGGATTGGGGASTQPGTKGGSKASGGSSLPSTASLAAGSPGMAWEPWWAFNRDPYLNLKAVVHGGELMFGSDDFFLGHAPLDAARDRQRPTDEVIHRSIVPALLKVLEHETDNDLVTGALVALAKIGNDPAGDESAEISSKLSPFLSSANQEIAETAAIALGILADPQSISTLEDLLLDSARGRELVGGHEVNWRTRAFAAYGLGLIGYRAQGPDVRRSVVHRLTEVLGGPALSMATPDVAVGCLIGLGLVPLPVDPSCVNTDESDPDPTHCRRCQVEWLTDFSRRGDLKTLVRAHTPTILVRLVAGSGLDPALKERVATELLRLARGGDKVQRDLRSSAISALGALGDADGDEIDRRIVTALQEVASTSREQQSRTLALIALGQVGGRRGGATGVDSETLTGVRRFLLEKSKTGRSSDRTWTAMALGQLERSALDAGFDGSAEVAGTLRTALISTRSPAEVGAHAVALGVMRDVESAEEVLKKIEAVSDDKARGYLCVSLGLMNARQSIDSLRELLLASRYRPLLLREVAISLGLLGDRDLVDDLIGQLHRATGLTAQSSIAAALGTIGDARSVDPLLEMLGDREVNVRGRAFAAVALGIVADKEPLPWNSKIAIGVNYRAGTPTLTDGQGRGVLDIL